MHLSWNKARSIMKESWALRQLTISTVNISNYTYMFGVF